MLSAVSNNKRKVKDCASSIFLQLGTISLYLFLTLQSPSFSSRKGIIIMIFLIKQATAVQWS